MTLNYVSLILDLYDGTGTPIGSGFASLTPSVILTDTVDHEIVTQSPVTAQFPGGILPMVSLLATDNADVLPDGWAWRITFGGPVNGPPSAGQFPGAPDPFFFFLPAAPFSFTATHASPCVFTASGSGYANGDQVSLSGGSLPGGFTAGITYFVVSASGHTFRLAATSGGSAIASTSTGSGTVATAAVYLSDLAPLSEAVVLSTVVASVLAGDGSIGIGGSATAITVETGPLDEIAALHPPVGAWSNAGQQINHVAAGVAGDDVATVSQVPNTAAFLQSANNLSDVASAGTSRTNLGLGTAATAALTSLLQAANNLSDLGSPTTARTNLGLGTAATAALTSLLQSANNLSELTSATTARTNLGLGSAATQASSAFDAAGAAATETSRAMAAEALALPKSGGTMSGAIAMGGNAVTGVSDLAVSGLTGATAASRYAGATTGGAPASGTFAAGDFVLDQAGLVWVCTAGGSPGTWVLISPNLELWAEPMIAGAGKPPVAVTVPRGYSQATVGPASGTAIFRGVVLVPGQVISNITLLTVAGETGGSHAWVAIADTTATIRAVSADNAGATFFAASSSKTIALASPYTVPSIGLYFVVLGVTATGMPTFVGGASLATGQSGMGSGQPLCGTCGSFGAPPSTGTALTLGPNAPSNLYAVLT